ncbi:MAG: 4-hydroxybenzoate octaprenyltransferase [Methylovirgula sp.]
MRAWPPDASAFFLRHTPPPLRPFLQLARLDRPIGWWLLLLPCWWSSLLASISRQAPPNLAHLALFFLGAVAMRGAGSTYNDLVDRDIDAKVERTAGRPLPSGRIGPRAACAFLLAQVLVGLIVLLCFNRFTIELGAASLLIVAIYPFMKRVTFWPQAVLGLAFSFGALLGWAAAYGRLGVPALLLYAGAVAWTMGYDTIYALQDIGDDLAAGVKSTALYFGGQVRRAVAAFYGAAVVLLALALFTTGTRRPLAIAGIVGMGAHLLWQVVKLDPADPDLALRLFRSNRQAGLILFAGLASTAIGL